MEKACSTPDSCLKYRNQAFAPKGNILLDQWEKIPCANCIVGIARATYRASQRPRECRWDGCKDEAAPGRTFCGNHGYRFHGRPENKIFSPHYNRDKTACVRGHTDSWYISKSQGFRRCRACDRIRYRERKARK